MDSEGNSVVWQRSSRNFKVVHDRTGNTTWQIPEQYDLDRFIGAGSFGQVMSAIDNASGIRVAIKKLTRPFQVEEHGKRTYREIRILKHMDHENIIGLLDLFTTATDFESFSDVYLVMPLMETDLHQILRTQRLSENHIEFLMYQIVRALKYVHAAGIAHRDIKPGNIALNANNELRLLDFGLARHERDTMSGYVSTRWWRAPEIILNWMHHGCPADMWSVGCIMAEMYLGKPLLPGRDFIHQLELICQVVGTPDDEVISKLKSESAQNYVRSMTKHERRNFHDLFWMACPSAVDLLERLLVTDPDRRLTAAEALQHPFLAKYADPDDEPELMGYNLKHENDEKLSIQQWKAYVFEEIQNFGFPILSPHAEETLPMETAV